MLLTFPLCLQDPQSPWEANLSHRPRGTCWPDIRDHLVSVIPDVDRLERKTKLGLWREGWAHSISWEVDQSCVGSSRALKMVPRKELPRN